MNLFLDEVSELPLALQAKLLRVLQERSFRPIGGHQQIEVDVRIVAASNRDLGEAAQQKLFRSDLFYRLNVVTLRLPPLRERPEDIGLLADHFLKRFGQDNKLPVQAIAPATLARLRAYDWPGNVRQLQNVVEYAATMASGAVIQIDDLPEEFQGAIGAEVKRAVTNVLFTEKNLLMDHFERDYLVALLVEHQFNISRAAAAAGCHRRTLYRMIHRQQLNLADIKRQRRGSSSSNGRTGAAHPRSADA